MDCPKGWLTPGSINHCSQGWSSIIVIKEAWRSGSIKGQEHNESFPNKLVFYNVVRELPASMWFEKILRLSGAFFWQFSSHRLSRRGT